jgi:hypothetical protein
MKLIAYVPCLLALASALPASAQSTADLKSRIELLESRIDRIETVLGPALQSPEQQAAQMEQFQKAQQAQAEAQMAQWKQEEDQARRTNKWLNPEPWTRLRVGMPRQEVEQLLGKPDRTVIGENNWLDCWYHATNKVANVSYRNERLIQFVSPGF